jgi:hypothetical protein
MVDEQTPALASALAALSASFIGDGSDPVRRERFLDTVSLVLMRMLPHVDHENVDDGLREMFQIAMARTGVNELVRTPKDFENVLGEFEAAHPPDGELVARIMAAIESDSSAR